MTDAERNAGYIRARYFQFLKDHLPKRREKRPGTCTDVEYEAYTKPLPDLVPARIDASIREPRRTGPAPGISIR